MTADDNAGRKRQRPGPRSYAGVPVVHKAHWKWLVIAYFFLGGIAGGSQAIAAIADKVGDRRSRQTVRAARYASFAAFLPCPLLLILDLGRPERFLHMLRVLKLRSPMSVGTWVLVLFGPVVAINAARQAGEDGWLPRRLAPIAHRLPGQALDAAGASLGVALAGYTGVLLGATAVPLWARRASLLGPLFLASAVSSSAAAVALVRACFRARHDPALAALEQTATLAESVLLAAWLLRLGRSGRPLQGGLNDRLIRHGVAGAGLAMPLLLNALARRRWGSPLAATAAVLTLIGGFLLRYLVVVGGHASADDPEATFEMTRGSGNG